MAGPLTQKILKLCNTFVSLIRISYIARLYRKKIFFFKLFILEIKSAGVPTCPTAGTDVTTVDEVAAEAESGDIDDTGAGVGPAIATDAIEGGDNDGTVF